MKYSYDSSYGELSSINFSFNNNSQFYREFKRDRLGRIVEENDGSGATTITYDLSGRLTGRSYKNSNIILSSYIYDKNGNRIRGFEGNKKFTAQYDDHDRLIKYNDTTFTYNPNGELQSKTTNGQETFYNYDTLGNLVAVNMPGKSVQYQIDPKNRRSAKIVNGNFMSRYVWQDQLRLVAELDSNNNVKSRFVYVEGVNSPEYMVKDGRKFMFVKDQRGSVHLVVDSETGEVKQKMRYSEWGEVLEDTNPGFQPFGFAGGLYDQDTHLLRFGARDYDPIIGKWNAKDPIRFESKVTNLYEYVLNDPINYNDYNGLSHRRQSDYEGGGYNSGGNGGWVGPAIVALAAACAAKAGYDYSKKDEKQTEQNLDELESDQKNQLESWDLK